MHRQAGGACGKTPEDGGCPLAIDSTSTEVKGLACLHWEWETSRLSLHGKTPDPAIWGVLMGVKVHQGAVRGFLGLRKERFLNLCIY